MMSKLQVIAATLCLAGCAQQPMTMPHSVQVMPTDCANRVAIMNWYQELLAVPRTYLQSQTEYQHAQTQIRYRMWQLRYHCQPV